MSYSAKNRIIKFTTMNHMISNGYAPEETKPTKEQYYCSECDKVLEQYFTYPYKKFIDLDMCPVCFVEQVNECIDRQEPTQELCEQWNDILKVIANEDRELTEIEYETIFNIINYESSNKNSNL